MGELRGYFVVQVDVHDRERYAVYTREVAGMVAAFGGTVLVGAESRRRAVEGDWNPERFFVIEFPSHRDAEAFYFSDAYQAVVGHRLASSRSLGLLAEQQAPPTA